MTAGAAGRASKLCCFFCEIARYPRSSCPGRNSRCSWCGKIGHYVKACHSGTVAAAAAQADEEPPSTPTSAASYIPSATPDGLSRATLKGEVNGQPADVLIDTGSSQSCVSLHLVKNHKWELLPAHGEVLMASTTQVPRIRGYCILNIQLPDHSYADAKLTVLPDLSTDVILGHDILHEHKSVEIPFGGSGPSLTVCSLATMAVPLPTLFGKLTPDCRPVTTKSRWHMVRDEKFIESEIRRMQAEGIIEQCRSPWRAQVLVTANENHKKRLVIDYS